MLEVDTVYTRFHGEGKTVPRLSAGLVISFGKMR